MAPTHQYSLALSSLWWVAKLGAIASLGILGLFMGAHALEGGPGPTVPEWLMLACFPGGVFLGLVLALWAPLRGGVLATVSLLMFYGIHFALNGSFPGGIFFLLFTSPAFLLLILGLQGGKYRGEKPT